MKALAETVIDDTLQRIRALVGDKGFITAADAMEPHLVEWRGLWRGQARAVVKPADTAEVAEVVKLCAEAGPDDDEMREHILQVPSHEQRACGGKAANQGRGALRLRPRRWNETPTPNGG